MTAGPGYGGRVQTEQTLSTRRALLMGGGAVAAAGVLLWVPDLLGVSVLPACPFRLMTGWDCPFCGGTRATRALVTGDLSTAADFNVLVPVMALAGVVVAAWWLLAQRAGPSVAGSSPQDGRRASVSFEPVRSVLGARVFWFVVLAVFLVFWVLRNLPAFSYLNSTG